MLKVSFENTWESQKFTYMNDLRSRKSVEANIKKKEKKIKILT